MSKIGIVDTETGRLVNPDIVYATISDLTSHIDSLTEHTVIWSGTTTNDTETEIYVNGVASDQYSIPISGVVGFDIRIVAIDSSANIYDAKHEGTIKHSTAGVTSMVGLVLKTEFNNEIGTWDSVVTADASTDALSIKVTGATSTTIKWNAVGKIYTVDLA